MRLFGQKPARNYFAWTLKYWLPLAVGLTGAFGFAYLVGQQGYRQSANDPQVQLAEDGASALAQGTAPAKIVGDKPVDVVSGLSPIVITYHSDGSLSAYNGSQSLRQTTPPAGVFEYARTHGRDVFTWQPEGHVRLAAVLVYSGSAHPGFVLAARNLREVEQRDNQLLLLAVAAWVVTLGTTLAATAGLSVLKS